ncbi:MAG: general stress protein [Planctomycetota bacterium]|nr:MAG: general stress protein [Planctomycetota bacterium]
MSTNSAHADAVDKLAELIRDIPVAMLTTMGDDGRFHSRPMANVNRQFAGDLWFFTRGDEPKAREVHVDPRVNVSFAAPEGGRYVSVSGRASLVHDPSRAKLLWEDATCEKWFPGGPEDPELALLKIELDEAEYWDETTSGMRALQGLLRTAFTGEPDRALENESVHWPGKN